MMDYEKISLMQHAVGQAGAATAFYKKKFEKYNATGVPFLSWNWAGLLFGILWFVYRKIWFVVLPLLLLLVLGEMLLSDNLALTVRLSAIFGGSIIGAIFGNQLYFIWVKFLVWQGKHNGKSGEELEAFLRREGGTIRNMPVSQFLKS